MSNIDSVRTPVVEPTGVGEDVTRKRESSKSHRTHAIGGPAVEALLGLAAIVLAILGLAGLFVLPFAAFALIAAGAALLFEGAAVAARGQVDRRRDQALVGGFGAEAITGLGAVTLGILAVVGIKPLTLLPVAAIVLGAGMLLAGGAAAREEAGESGVRSDAGHGSVLAASGLHTLIGAGSIVLGILGLLGNAPVTLTLIAALAVGAGLLLSGAALGGRMVALFERRA